MQAQWRLPLLVVATVLIGAAFAILVPGKPYPACDSGVARAMLARLYDNRRLLRAVDVRDLRLLSDGFKGRYCAATVMWANGLESEVKYEFYRSGRYNEDLSMWIDYNGGMRGPPL